MGAKSMVYYCSKCKEDITSAEYKYSMEKYGCANIPQHAVHFSIVAYIPPRDIQGSKFDPTPIILKENTKQKS